MRVLERIRATKPREVVLSILEGERGHLTAKQIFDIAGKIYPGIGFASVYRALRLFEKENIVEVLTLEGRERCFQLKKRRSPVKMHLICTNCNKIKDFSGRDKELKNCIKKFEEILKGKYNFEMSTLDIKIFGKCTECKKEV